MTREDEAKFHDQKIDEWVNYYHLNKQQAEICYNEAYSRWHSCWSDMENCADEVAEFAEKILKLNN